MKNVTIVVEFTAQVADDVGIDNITCDIDPARIIPQVQGVKVGDVTGYTTPNIFNDEV
jgi:hypothetical protein